MEEEEEEEEEEEGLCVDGRIVASGSEGRKRERKRRRRQPAIIENGAKNEEPTQKTKLVWKYWEEDFPPPPPSLSVSIRSGAHFAAAAASVCVCVWPSLRFLLLLQPRSPINNITQAAEKCQQHRWGKERKRCCAAFSVG